MAARKPHPSDVSDEEWVLVAPYLACCPRTPDSLGPSREAKAVPASRVGPSPADQAAEIARHRCEGDRLRT